MPGSPSSDWMSPAAGNDGGAVAGWVGVGGGVGCGVGSVAGVGLEVAIGLEIGGTLVRSAVGTGADVHPTMIRTVTQNTTRI